MEDPTPVPDASRGESTSKDKKTEPDSQAVTDLHKHLLDAAEKAADDPKRVSDLIDQMASSQTPNFAPRNDNGETPLIVLLRNGCTDEDLVIKLLGKMSGDEIDATDKTGSSALHESASENLFYAADALLSRGAKPDLRDELGRTPLHHACWSGFLDIVKLLVKHSVEHSLDLDAKDNDGCTPLDHACQSGHTDVVRHLMDPGRPGAVVNVDIVDNDGWTPLSTAARFGHGDIVNDILGHGAIVDTADDEGLTPLLVAARFGHGNVVQALLSRGATVDKADNKKWTPLKMAARYGHGDIVEALLRQQATVDTADDEGWTPLLAAARYGHGDIVEALLRQEATVDTVNDEGWTPLLAAAEFGHRDIVESLLRNRAHRNKAAKDGRTPLSRASASGYADIVSVLLRDMKSGDVDIPDNEGMTPLHWACCSSQYGEEPLDGEKRGSSTPGQYLQTVEHLIEKGAKLDALTNAGETALDLAVQKRHRQTAMALLQHSGPVKATEINGDILDWAIEDERTHGIVRMKIKEGPRVHTQYKGIELKENCTVLELATFHGDSEIVWKLLRTPSVADVVRGTREDAKRVLDEVEEQRRRNKESTKRPERDDFTRKDKQKTSGKDEKKTSAEDEQWTSAKDKQKTPSEDEETDAHYALIKELLNGKYIETSIQRLKAPEAGVTVAFKPPTAIFDFYAVGIGSRVQQSKYSVVDVIYGEGPEKLMEKERQRNKFVERLLGKLRSQEEGIQANATPNDPSIQAKETFQFRWIHLPANNMQWMEDLTMKVLHEQATTAKALSENAPGAKVEESEHDEEFRKLSSFLQNSWLEFPNASSSSRLMKPKFVKTKLAVPRAPKPQAPESKDLKSPASDDNETERFALYMPYLTFATQKKNTRGNEYYDEYEKLLNDYKKEVIHGSRTLDEFFYQFKSDKLYSEDDIAERNKDQVVTKWLHRDAQFKVLDKQGIKELDEWTLLRVDQLWLWVIGPKTIITSSTHRLDGREDIVLSSVQSHLQKSNDLPKTVQELTRLLVDICIRLYDEAKEPESASGRGVKLKDLSVRDIFSNSINKAAVEETELFKIFTESEETNGEHKMESKQSTTNRNGPMVRAARLLCTIKDLRDELNILRAVVSQQQHVHKAVQDGLFRGQARRSQTTSQIVSEIKDMDKYAERLNAAVDATLGLQQNNIAIGYSTESVEQGNTLMVFTVTTIIFLPMSFLAALFAINISVFPHDDETKELRYSPGLIFPIIFGVTAVVSAPLILYAFQERILKRHPWLRGLGWTGSGESDKQHQRHTFQERMGNRLRSLRRTGPDQQRHLDALQETLRNGLHNLRRTGRDKQRQLVDPER